MHIDRTHVIITELSLSTIEIVYVLRASTYLTSYVASSTYIATECIVPVDQPLLLHLHM